MRWPNGGGFDATGDKRINIFFGYASDANPARGSRLSAAAAG